MGVEIFANCRPLSKISPTYYGTLIGTRSIRMSVPVTLSDLERQDARAQFFRRKSICTLVGLRLTNSDRIRHANPRAVCLQVVRYAPIPKGKALPNLGVYPLLMLTPCGRRTTKFGVVTHTGRDISMWAATPPSQRAGAPAHPSFWTPTNAHTV